MRKRLPTLLRSIGWALVMGMTTVCPAWAQAAPPHHFASLHFLHPIATSPDPETSTNFRLSLLYGRSGRINGLDLNAVAGTAIGPVTGLQFGGLYNGNGATFGGASFTLGVNRLHGPGHGAQFAFLANYDEDVFVGASLAGVLNYTDSGFAGAQISGVMNLNDRGGTFLQLGSVANINAGPFAGLQLSGLLNSANDAISGGQLALANYAEDMRGVQVGLINTGDRFHGLKVGVLNTGREVTGTTVGLVNMDRDSRREWMLYGSNLALAGAGFRTVLNRWSSVVSLGYGDAKGDIDQTLFLGWNFGRNIPLGGKWDLTVDLGFVHIIPKKSDNPAENDRLQYALQARALGEYRLKRHLGLFGAVGPSTRYAAYASDAPHETDFHFSAGVVFYR